jgi:hypothetical protein
MAAGREVRLVQRNADRTKIFAVVTTADGELGYGPLTIGGVWLDLYDGSGPEVVPGDPHLGAELTGPAAEVHPLDDYYRFYGYSPDVIEWIEATPLSDERAAQSFGRYEGGGRKSADVAERLGLDLDRLNHDGYDEGVMPGHYDPSGDPAFFPGFGAGNWAVSDPSGRVKVNPNAYRFKAWLSLGPQS